MLSGLVAQDCAIVRGFSLDKTISLNCSGGGLSSSQDLPGHDITHQSIFDTHLKSAAQQAARELNDLTAEEVDEMFNSPIT